MASRTGIVRRGRIEYPALLFQSFHAGCDGWDGMVVPDRGARPDLVAPKQLCEH